MFGKQSQSKDKGPTTTIDDLAWRERVTKENRAARVLWPNKWGWLPEAYRKVNHQLSNYSLQPLQTSCTVCSLAEVPDLPSDMSSASSTTIPSPTPTKHRYTRQTTDSRVNELLAPCKSCKPRGKWRTVSSDYGRKCERMSANELLNYTTRARVSAPFNKQMGWPKNYCP